MLHIRTANDLGRACVEVRDTGHGIAAEVIDRIFDPFFTTKPVGRGRGLGLSIGNRIVTDHGGSIAVSSDPGQGATFRLCLPGTPPMNLPASA
jgi:two-component system NtrC family sensor kinase